MPPQSMDMVFLEHIPLDALSLPAPLLISAILEWVWVWVVSMRVMQINGVVVLSGTNTPWKLVYILDNSSWLVCVRKYASTVIPCCAFGNTLVNNN